MVSRWLIRKDEAPWGLLDLEPYVRPAPPQAARPDITE